MKPLKRILHVEDVASIQLVTRVALEKLGGFEVLSCQSGEQALAQIERFAPDLLLLDVMLEHMDGLDLLRELSTRRDLQQVPVVLLSGYIEPERLAQFALLGVRQALKKPFDPLLLASQLRAIWLAEHG